MELEKNQSELLAPKGSPIRQFAIKTGIIMVAIIVVLTYLDNIIDQRIERIHEQIQTTIGSATKIGGRDFWSKLERELEKQAGPETDISPEKKQKILSEIRIISDRWRPFVTEVRSAVVGDGAASTK